MPVDAYNTYTQNTLLLCLTFLQGILHDRRSPGWLQAAGWPEERFDLPADLLAWIQALPHPPEELHLLLQQRHDLCVLLLQQIWPAETDRKKERETDSEENRLWYMKQTYPCFHLHKDSKCFSLTSHLLGFSLQLSLVIFCLTGNPFILIFLPVKPSNRRKQTWCITANKLYRIELLQTIICSITYNTYLWIYKSG